MILQGIELQNALLKQLDEGRLSPNEKALVRCKLSKEFEDVGNYEAAQGIFGALWPKVGERPRVDEFDEKTKAEVLMRAGAVTGFIGQAKQIEGAQEKAKDLISESLLIFGSSNDSEKEAEALTELGYCYWREGSLDNARATLKTALQKLEHAESDLKATATLRLAIVENLNSHAREALRILTDAEILFVTSTSHALRGKFHMNRATFKLKISLTEKSTKERDEALIEFAAASFHLKEAGHTRYWARSENNLGYMLFTIGKFSEAHEHLDRAYHLFTNLKEISNAGQVDETRARAFLAEGLSGQAVKAATRATAAQERGDEQGLLAEALTTLGISLAREKRDVEAKQTLERAAKIFETLGEKESTALSYLSMIEELHESHSNERLRNMYYYADSLVGTTNEPEILTRLRNCASIVLSLEEREKSARPGIGPEFIYASPKIAKIVDLGKRVARTSNTVLITGESGTGKEILAKHIHIWSGRVGRIVELNCSNLNDNLFESQLFGHEKGSFTGAVEDTPGLVAQADGGTLFLDEIGELSLSNQAKILRLIENREVLKVGGGQPKTVDVRIVAATNRDLKLMVGQKTFREDLYFRISPFELHIPPLRERPEDVSVLTTHLIKEATTHYDKTVLFTEEALAELRLLPLKGNVRELRILIERAVVLAPAGAIIQGEDIKTAILRGRESVSFSNAWSGCDLDREVFKYEADLISLALKTAGGGITRAAQLLGLTHQNLREKLKGKFSLLAHERNIPKARKKSIIDKSRLVKRKKSSKSKS